MTRNTTKLVSVLGLAAILAVAAAQPADARRGGSFGSRGMRTYSAPAPTRTAPQQTAPVQRSMTASPAKAAPGSQATAPANAAAAAPQRRGFMGGMGGGLLGGLLAGGLIGALLGNGFGGLGAGMMNTLLQVALIGGGVMLLMMLLRRRPSPQAAFAGAAPVGFARDASAFAGFGGGRDGGRDSGLAAFGGGAAAATPNVVEFEVTQADRDAFERLLGEIQAAFGAEDYGALRGRTTPEVMSYLSEELSQNATQGRRNRVTATRLLQADVGEAWREGGVDYATAAMRYESIDVMTDRTSGAVLEGDPDTPTQTTELWTFTRQAGLPWKLSAIQDA
jgi:predicted lipid-binding transport protein (Tim44 family)